jgi:hypothetical protein
MQTQLIIAGVKQFKGVVDGSEFDHTKLIVMLPFSKSRSDVNQGFDVIEANYGKSSNFAQFVGRKFPITCIGEIEMSIGSGGRQTTDILSVDLPKA